MKTLFFFAAILLALSSCTNQGSTTNEPDPAAPADPTDTLVGVYWQLKTLNAKPLADYPAQNKEPYLMFTHEGNRVEGTGGCNGMAGTYTLQSNNQILISELASTKMACPDMTLETDFQIFLMDTITYSITRDELILTRADTPLSATFMKSAPK